jgi:hypothetical protein
MCIPYVHRPPCPIAKKPDRVGPHDAALAEAGGEGATAAGR